MILTFFKGFCTGGGLIVAIGAQNAFVLSHGIRKSHNLVIPLICSVCDALLITAGIMGTGTLIASSDLLTTLAFLGGAAFLFYYGLLSLKSALRGGTLAPDETTRDSLRSVVLATLAVTLLNPHAYLDTIVLVGSLSAQFQDTGRLFFGAGAVTASFLWFFSLSVGGKMLAPLFQKPLSWRVLDTLVCVVMWAISVSLIVKV